MSATSKHAAKAGVFGIGLEAYWAQFPGLKERLEGYQWHVEEQIGRWATVVSCGLVDTAPEGRAAGARFAEVRVDLIFCYVGTYATSSQVLPAVRSGRALARVSRHYRRSRAPSFLALGGGRDVTGGSEHRNSGVDSLPVA